MGPPSTLAEGEQGRAGFDDEADYRSNIFSFGGAPRSRLSP
jgi:hypothetical protein